MNLKTLPISFKGELHDVQLISFSVHQEEVVPFLPDGIHPIITNDRVHFSLVSVQLKQMRANLFPVPFNYHHVALRLRIEDAKHNESNENQGIFFFRSFTNNPMMVSGGKLLTNYNLERANFNTSSTEMEVETVAEYIKFALETNGVKESNPELFKSIQRLDRAYLVADNRLYRTVIGREEWPIKWADCYAFETNMFQTATVEGAFYIDHPIHYKWNAPQLVLNAKLTKGISL